MRGVAGSQYAPKAYIEIRSGYSHNEIDYSAVKIRPRPAEYAHHKPNAAPVPKPRKIGARSCRSGSSRTMNVEPGKTITLKFAVNDSGGIRFKGYQTSIDDPTMADMLVDSIRNHGFARMDDLREHADIVSVFPPAAGG